MKNDEVKIGGTYKAKVSDKLTTVRIDVENPHGGWDATNLITNKKVRIKSAQRLRVEASVPGGDKTPKDGPRAAKDGEAKDKATDAAEADTGEHGATGGKGKKKTKKKKPSPNTPPWAKQKDRERLRAQHKADQENARVRDEREAASDGMTASERAMAESEGKGKKKTAATKATGNGDKKMGCIDAAVEVLKDSDAPMNTKQMVEAMAERGLWSSDAATPHATLYSGILREIQKKGDESRFEKADRGKFQIRKGA